VEHAAEFEAQVAADLVAQHTEATVIESKGYAFEIPHEDGDPKGSFHCRISIGATGELVVPWVLYTVDDSSNPSGLIASGIAEKVPMAAALVASAVRCKIDELI